MSTRIREMLSQDKLSVIEMMEEFYHSPAVFTDGSIEIFEQDVEHCISDCPYLEGYVFQGEEQIQGYGMVAKSFSTEFGKPCIWIEDIYIKKEYRRLGIGTQFLQFIEQKYSQALLRLEVEEDNEKAIQVYKKCGFDFLPYREMKKEIK